MEEEPSDYTTTIASIILRCFSWHSLRFFNIWFFDYIYFKSLIYNFLCFVFKL